MKKKLFLVIVIAGLIAAAVTNPGVEQHRDAVRAKVNAHLQESLPDDSAEPDSMWDELSRALAETLGKEFVDAMIDNLVSTDNHILFSRTRISLLGETEIIGFGIFGHVFLSRKLDETLEGGLLED